MLEYLEKRIVADCLEVAAAFWTSHRYSKYCHYQDIPAFVNNRRLLRYPTICISPKAHNMPPETEGSNHPVIRTGIMQIRVHSMDTCTTMARKNPYRLKCLNDGEISCRITLFLPNAMVLCTSRYNPIQYGMHPSIQNTESSLSEQATRPAHDITSITIPRSSMSAIRFIGYNEAIISDSAQLPR